MANVVIGGTATGATPLPVAVSIDGANDLLAIYTASAAATQAISRQTLLGVTGQPADISTIQTLTNKTLTAPAISGPTLSGTVVGTYTLGGTPTLTAPTISAPVLSGSVTGTYTLAGTPTLTSPTINAPTITNATISADAILGFTTSTSGTVYGLSIASGAFTTAGYASSTALQTNAVQANQLAANVITLGSAQITSNFTTTTVSAYVDVTSLAVTVTVPAGGRDVEIIVSASNIGTSAVAGTVVEYAVREGSTVLGKSLLQQPVTNYAVPMMLTVRVPAPTPGSHTYKVSVAQSAAGTITVAASAASNTVLANLPATIYAKAI